jgi:hypothetical protein
MGRKVFRTTLGDFVRQTCTSARDVIYGLDDSPGQPRPTDRRLS